MIDKFLSFKPSKRCGHETVIQSNNEGGRVATVYSSTTRKAVNKNCSSA